MLAKVPGGRTPICPALTALDRLQRLPGQGPSSQLPPALAWHLLGDRDTLLDAVDLQLLWHRARGGPSRLAGGAVGLHRRPLQGKKT